jgi:probable rRNA maturation factor
MLPVRFNHADVKQLLFKRKKVVKEIIIRIFLDEEKIVDEINYIFCSDLYLLEINKEYLSHDFFTDIISFDLSEGEVVTGEVYISIDRVKENAIIHSTSFKNELLRVIFHGALHLSGYNDKKKSEITVMRKKEDYYLQLFEEKLQ